MAGNDPGSPTAGCSRSLLYGLYSWLGLVGIIVYRVALSFAVAAALHRLVARREPRFLVATLLTGVGVATISVLFDERPWLFTILFTTWTLDVVLDLRDGRPNRLLLLLPTAYALWANLHIQFVYGLGVLGLACLAPVVDRLLGRDAVGDGGFPPRFPRLAAAAGADDPVSAGNAAQPVSHPPLRRRRGVRHPAGAVQSHQ